MSKPKKTPEELKKKYDIGEAKKRVESATKSTSNQNGSGKQNNSSASPKKTPEELKKKYDIGEAKKRVENATKFNTTKQPTKKLTDFNTETKTAYSNVKNKVNTKTTIPSNLTDDERKSRIKEINGELRTLNDKLSGYSRAKLYSSNKYLEEAEQKDRDRIAELSEELKSLERTGTFSASELKQFEIDDAKKKVATARQKVDSYGQRPSTSVAEEWRAAASEQFNAEKELKELKRQKTLYDDIAKFGDVVNEDDFFGQWRANYRAKELSEDSAKAFSTYMDNPTEENREIALAYDAFIKEYMKNNEKALDDEGQVLPLLSDNFASYLAQQKGSAGIAVPLGIAGAAAGLLGGGAGAKAGWTAGYSIGSGINSYNVIRGSLFSELLSYGMDEESAKKLANDDAIIEALIESGETAKDWAFMLYGGGTGAAKSVLSKALTKTAKSAAKSAAHPILNLGWNIIKGTGLNAGTEYFEEGLQGAVSRATREKAWAMIDNEIGQYGEGNIDLYDRPIYKNADGTLSTVDSVTFTIDGKYVVLPTIVRDEKGNAKRLETDEEIFEHYKNTGEYLGEFDTLEEANIYANRLHFAQAYKYSDNTSVDADDNALIGGAKVIGDAIFGGNTEALSELHEQGVEGFKTGIISGGIHGTVKFAVSSYANAKTIKEQNEIADFVKGDEESLNALIEEGKSSGEGTVSAKIAEEVEQAKEKGEVTREQVKKLIASNEVYINEEEKRATPTTLEQAAMDVVNERNRTSTPISLDEVKKVTGFGDNGAKLATELASQDGMTFEKASNEMKVAYLSGYQGEDITFTNDLQNRAKLAGIDDRIADNNIALERAKNATVNKESGFDKTNLPSDVTKRQAEIVDLMSKGLGYKTYVKKGLKGNAEIHHDTGEVAIDFDFQREIGSGNNKQKVSIVFHAAHEMALHGVVERAPEEGRAFVYAMYKHLAGDESLLGSTLADKKRSAYAKQDVNISLAEAMEEISANNILYLYGNNEVKFQKAMESIVNGNDVKAKQGLQKYIDYLTDFIKKIGEFLKGKTKEERAEIQAELDEVTKLRDMFETAFAKAVENRKEIQAQNINTNFTKNLENKMNEDYNRDVSHSLKEANKDNSAFNNVPDKSEYIGYVPVQKVKMKTFPPYNQSKSDANEWSTRWAHREDVETGAQTLVFYHNRCYVIGKYDGADLKYQIDGRISYSAYESIRKELEEDARNREEQSQKKMVDFLRERNERRDSDEGRGQSFDNSAVEYGREDRDILQLGRKQNGERELQGDIGRSDEYDSKDRKAKGLNESVSFSLKDEYWRTDLNKTQYAQVEKWIRQAGNPESTRITDTANWYKGRIDGKDLFVIYSDKPTILYEVSGENALFELDILMDLLEDEENGKSINGESSFTQRVSKGSWMQDVNSSQNNIRRMGSGGNNQNAGVLQRQSKRNGSPAFRNVIENLFREQEQSTTGNGKEQHSLKGTVVEGELASLVKKYGAIPKGENPAREIQVPRKTAKDKNVSQTVRTILEAKATPDDVLPTIEELVTKGEFSYDVYTDKEAISNAEENITQKGWGTAKADWYKSVGSGEVSKKNTAEGWVIYNNAVNSGDVETALEVLNFMVKHQRSAAQALQATRILKKLSPETQLYGVQKGVLALQNELTDKYGDKAPDLKINEELAEQFLNAKTPEERAEIEKEIYKDIGRQMPSRFIDKWNAWRYLAMLGNARTHIRNIVGNAGFAPVVLTKNLTATAIESVVSRVSGKKTLRGKSIITGNKADRTLLKAAWDDYSIVADLISNGGKYNDSAMANRQIEEGRQIFKSKPLEWARKKNSQLLETEDMWFAKPHYAFALAQYCKANNITAEQIKKGKAIGPARDYAIKEAQKATYRDTNAFSQMVSEWGRSNNNEKNVVKKAFNTTIEGILPFRKTPANILVRGVEYSPLGLLKGLSYDLVQVSKGKMSASEVIDNISAGLTGTGLLALGVFLAAQGLIRGHGEDEEEKEFKELMGHQSYALELPSGQSITLDWLAPEALPFFVGVNLWETTKGTDEKVNFSSILQAISGITEPMLEMSCLQSLNDLFESVGYASSNDTSGLVTVLSSAATSYLTQGIPTLSGQAERTDEENRMTTFTEKNSFFTGDMQYTLGKMSAKIPIWDYNQIPYIDAWGRKEASGTALKRGLNNFFNPAYTSTIETSKMEEELLRLYEATGEGGVFPTRADKYFTVNGDRKDLTADEYVRYATLKGEKSYKLVADLVKSKAYKKLSDTEKVKAIKETYDYANQKAKQAISNYKPETWVSKADGFGSNVGNYISFKTEVNGTKEDNGGKISKQKVVDIILDMAQNDSETWKMYLSMYDSESDKYAYNKGIQGQDYMDFLVSLDKYDKPTKSGKYGTYTQEEVKKAIDNMQGLSRKEKSALYQSVNTGWKNNPY